MFEKKKIFARREIKLMDLADLFYNDNKSLEAQYLIKNFIAKFCFKI